MILIGSGLYRDYQHFRAYFDAKVHGTAFLNFDERWTIVERGVSGHV